jgi:hypothetical protein
MLRLGIALGDAVNGWLWPCDNDVGLSKKRQKRNVMSPVAVDELLAF